MQKYILFIFLLCCICGQAQISEDFSDGEISTNPEWLGDKSDFIVNTENELQLMAPEAGTSLLYTAIQTGGDMEWDMYLKMDFSPSGSNKTTLYLMLDNPDPTLANGYGITAGESGSDDAIVFFKLINGSKQTLADATLGAMAVNPSIARVHVSVTQNRLWTLSADYTGGNIFNTEIEIDDEIENTGSNYFVIECKYTATRTEHFFFDDFILPFVPDTTSPLLESSFIEDDNSLLLCFNEDILLPNETDLQIIPSIGISSIEYVDTQKDKIKVLFSTMLDPGLEYTIDLNNISDLSGNNNTIQGIKFFIISEPSKGDLIVNEILADPISGGFDFVEIKNKSSKKIALDNIGIANLDKEEFDYIENISYLEPGSYLAICPNIEFLENTYTIQNPSSLLENDIPSFNISEGNVSIVYDDGNTQLVIDSFDYTQDQHYILLETTKGVSLERISQDLETNNKENWHSASSAAGFATPGYENSISNPLSDSQSAFSLDKKVFSPDGDGFEDVLFLNYSFDKPGYLININIFDANGRFILNLEESLLPSTQGFVKWNGTNLENRRMPIGLYIMHVTGFHPDGDSIENKLVFAIGEQL